MDEAEQKALTLASAWVAAPIGRREPSLRNLNYLPQLDASIAYSNDPSSQGAYLELESISRHGNDWILTVHGFWTARIVLDSDYNLKSWERVPDEPKEK